MVTVNETIEISNYIMEIRYRGEINNKVLKSIKLITYTFFVFHKNRPSNKNVTLQMPKS